MTLHDRGTKKWVSLMLPEHVRELHKSLIDESKITKPILDEQQIELMEEVVLEAIEKNVPLLFSIFDEGFIKTIKGKVNFIDHLKKQFRVKDASGYTNLITFKDVISIEKSEHG